ncbi:TPA: glycosyltransferase [Morganella morganii]|nr:glycosyltransferase [Morganella morganii]
MTKIGIPILFTPQHWMGGINYFTSLISAFSLVEQDDIEIILFCEKKGVFETSKYKNVRQVIIPNLLKPNFFQRVFNRIFGINYLLFKKANEHNINILSHSQFSRIGNFKTLWWKPDFQEKYYPEFFQKKDIILRDKAVRLNAKYSSLLFSSQDAMASFLTFYNSNNSNNIYTLPFVPELNINEDDICTEHADINLIKEKYNIKTKYFFLPNQFWKHKNHQLVIKAILELNKDAIVVATGILNDYRGNDHILYIKNLLLHDVENKFKLLGLIDRKELTLLMKGAVAVINPSRFEGWSTTVEEAKYLGKRLILSDIPIHREQNPPDSIYVDCDNVKEMVSAMNVILSEYNDDNEKIRRTIATKNYIRDRKEFGFSYYNILKKL